MFTSRLLAGTSLVAAILGASALSGASVAQAQQGPTPATIRLPPEDAAPEFYGGQHNFYFLAPGQTGEANYQNAGFFGQRLRPYLSSSPDAVNELDSYRSQKTLFLVDRALVLGSVVVYAVQVFGHGDAQYFNDVQKGAASVAAVSILATIFINRNTANHLRQAVDNYNSTLPDKDHSTVWPRLRPATLGVAATPQGQPMLALGWRL
ncbi:MAG: hypothetical protein ACRYFX_02765 [Janthinobacterium lividum]